MNNNTELLLNGSLIATSVASLYILLFFLSFILCVFIFFFN